MTDRDRAAVGVQALGVELGPLARQASDWAAKASLSSTTSTSPQPIPALASARLAACTGAMPKMSGSTACVPRLTIRASGSPGSGIVADQQGGRAVVERAGVAGGHRAVGGECGLQRGSASRGSCPGRRFSSSVELGARYRDHPVGVEPGVPRLRGQPVRARGEIVLGRAVDAVDAGQLLGAAPSEIVHWSGIAGLTIRQPSVVEWSVWLPIA